MKTSFATTSSLAVLALAFGLAGCSEGDGKVPISGTVNWNGSPLKKGKITFLQPGQSSESADVVNGEFQVRTSPGDKKVGVTAFREVHVSGGDRHGEIRHHQFLPVKYNEQSTLIVTIADSGESVDFNLEGREVEPSRDADEFQRRPQTDSGRSSRNSRGSENRRPTR